MVWTFSLVTLSTLVANLFSPLLNKSNLSNATTLVPLIIKYNYEDDFWVVFQWMLCQ